MNPSGRASVPAGSPLDKAPAGAPPGGEPRKASQRNKRNMGSAPANISPVWRASMPVLWSGRAGVFRREVGDGEHAEVVIDGRVYRVRLRELS